MKARVSAYYHKSLNVSEESEVQIEPRFLERAANLRHWYSNLQKHEQDFHPLSGGLDVEQEMKPVVEQE